MLLICAMRDTQLLAHAGGKGMLPQLGTPLQQQQQQQQQQG
jgi:hypothetical protein